MCALKNAKHFSKNVKNTRTAIIEIIKEREIRPDSSRRLVKYVFKGKLHCIKILVDVEGGTLGAF